MTRPSFAALMASVGARLHDLTLQYGGAGYVREAVQEEFIQEAMRWYSQAEVTQWLVSIGMEPKKPSTMASRVGGKVRVPQGDGTYVLDGIVFGEAKPDIITDTAVEHAARPQDDKLAALQSRAAKLADKLL
jgi:hypothetical protein